ncbi:hypothetical protein HYU16_03750 [Candidatus Woesearchaeota archaeon]|nr:hypothetical protein [Candidatus Woesearchaeota archaeon]
MAWNPVRGMLGRLGRERADAAVATKDETVVEKEQAEATADIEAFRGGLRAEAGLLRDLAGLQSRKYGALRLIETANAANARISAAKKQLLSTLSVGRKRIAILSRKARIGFSGATVVDPAFGQKMSLWEQEQAKEIQLLEREVAIAIREEQQEAASVGPVIQLNKEIRGKLKEYQDVLGAEDRRLIDAVNMELQEIRNSRDSIARERDELRTDIEDLKRRRGVTGVTL